MHLQLVRALLPVPAAKIISRARQHAPFRALFQDDFLESAGDGVEFESFPFLAGVPEEPVRLLAAHPLRQLAPIAVSGMGVQAAAPKIVLQMVPGLQAGLSEALLQREALENALKEVLQKDERESILVVA
jgi:hypothetical protein